MRLSPAPAVASLLVAIALPLRAQSVQPSGAADSARAVTAPAAPVSMTSGAAVPATVTQVTTPAAATLDQSTPTEAAPAGMNGGAPSTGLRAGVHARESTQRTQLMQPDAAATRAGLGQARAMMVVGVAALITGAIIGGTPGTIVMVGGAVIGLLGLYDYLQ